MRCVWSLQCGEQAAFLPVIDEFVFTCWETGGLDEIYRISTRPESRFLFLGQTVIQTVIANAERL